MGEINLTHQTNHQTSPPAYTQHGQTRSHRAVRVPDVTSANVQAVRGECNVLASRRPAPFMSLLIQHRTKPIPRHICTAYHRDSSHHRSCSCGHCQAAAQRADNHAISCEGSLPAQKVICGTDRVVRRWGDGYHTYIIHATDIASHWLAYGSPKSGAV